MRARMLNLRLAGGALVAVLAAVLTFSVACGSDAATGDAAQPAAGQTAVAEAAHSQAATDADHEDADHEDADHHDADHEDASAHTANLDAGDARTVTVTATEFSFEPAEIHVQAGETVKLVLHNEGSVLHDITSMQFVGEAEAVGGEAHHHSSTMANMEEMAFHTAAQSQESGELLFVATEPGRYELFCSVPGHKELGMTATLVVE